MFVPCSQVFRVWLYSSQEANRRPSPKNMSSTIAELERPRIKVTVEESVSLVRKHKTRQLDSLASKFKQTTRPAITLTVEDNTYYQVKKNESLEKVARKFHCTAAEIAAENSELALGSIKETFPVGTVIKLPKFTGCDDYRTASPHSHAGHNEPAAAPQQQQQPQQSAVIDLSHELLRSLHHSPGGVGAQVGKDVVVLVHAPWCPFCVDMQEEYEALAHGLQHDDTVVVAKTRGDLDRAFSREIGVRSFPTLLAFPKQGGNPFAYGSENRSVEFMLKFANMACRSAPGAHQLQISPTSTTSSSSTPSSPSSSSSTSAPTSPNASPTVTLKGRSQPRSDLLPLASLTCSTLLSPTLPLPMAGFPAPICSGGAALGILGIILGILGIVSRPGSQGKLPTDDINPSATSKRRSSRVTSNMPSVDSQQTS